MSGDPQKNMSREERLAAKLRENLRRRKAQSRALDDAVDESPAKSLVQAKSLPKDGDAS